MAFLGAPWPVWTLSFACVRKVQAVGKLGVMKSRIFFEQERGDGKDSAHKTRFCIRSSIGSGAKRETEAEMDLAELLKTASLEQVTDLMREIQQQDVCV